MQFTGTSQIGGYKFAEDFLNRCNTALVNNEVQWQSPGATYVCQPIRYVLAGIYMHCLSNAQGGYSTPTLHANWGVNKTTEINVYVAIFPADAQGDATGIAYATYASIDWIDTGNFNHEIGHVFTLRHSWLDDLCNDTPPLTYNWDRNCDGDTNDDKEKTQQCWTYIEPDRIVGQPGYVDGNENDVHDCNEMLPCTPSPCCDWGFVNNNVMAYGKFKTAYTRCQIRKMLVDLAGPDCGYIAQIGGACPPPNAFITQTPLDLLNTKYCGECIVLEASYNDASHRLQIIEYPNGQYAYNPGWQSGPATNFCFTTEQPAFGNYLKPNTTYRVILTVKNACGTEHVAYYAFTTPDSKCTLDDPNDPNEEMYVSPNPGSGSIQIKFGGDLNEKFRLSAANNWTGNNMVLFQNHFAVAGENIVDVNISALTAGSYTLSLLGDHHLYQVHFVKF